VCVQCVEKDRGVGVRGGESILPEVDDLIHLSLSVYREGGGSHERGRIEVARFVGEREGSSVGASEGFDESEAGGVFGRFWVEES